MENKVYEGIHYSRFAASWHHICEEQKIDLREIRRRTGRLVSMERLMTEWLMTLLINGKTMDEDVARDISDFAYNGKLELETHARFFIRTLKGEA